MLRFMDLKQSQSVLMSQVLDIGKGQKDKGCTEVAPDLTDNTALNWY